MKKVFAVIALVSLQFAMKINCNAQTGCATQVPNGLMLHLDAAQGYNPATGNWTDQSPRNNNMSVFSGVAPALAVGANGFPVVRFAGNSILQNTTLNGDFSATTKTVFIISTSSTNVQAPISVVSTIGTVNNEFLLQGNTVYHHNADAFWGSKTHQCAALLTAPGPKLFTGAWDFGFAPGDLNFYVNGILSTSAFTINGGNPLANYTNTTRRVYIGGRNYALPYFFAGDIYEVLVYDRLLTVAEINTINQYYIFN